MPNKSKSNNVKKGKENVSAFPGYPIYPASEDIYSQFKKEGSIDPEDTSKFKETEDNLVTRNEKDFNDDVSGRDLDIPGSELDDQMEIIGSEDEENNGYSLGGDNHTDLEEKHDD